MLLGRPQPPFESFPAMPGLFRRYLAECAGALDAAAERVCAERPRTTWISSTGAIEIEANFFARDNFHPSAYGYRRWTHAVAERLPPIT